MRCRKFWVRIDLIPLYSRYPDRVIFGDNKIFTLNLLELGLLTRSALTQHHAHPVLSWDSGEGRLEIQQCGEDERCLLLLPGYHGDKSPHCWTLSLTGPRVPLFAMVFKKFNGDPHSYSTLLLELLSRIRQNKIAKDDKIYFVHYC